MSKQQTALRANANLLSGEKLYLERARITLPYLVRQAKAEQPIYYSSLAEEIGIDNPRNLNYILGSIGNALIQLGKKEKIEIPPIQCLVINKAQDLPGEGIEWFISNKAFNKLSKTQKRKIVDSELAKIYSFNRWDWVLGKLGLHPIDSNIESILLKARQGNLGGESKNHKNFKKFICENPQVLGLNKSFSTGTEEYKLPSADAIDVLFISKKMKVGVEVKSHISDVSDILRGIFQCVKYKALIEAEQKIKQEFLNTRVILALQGSLPQELVLIKNILGVEVLDNIEIM